MKRITLIAVIACLACQAYALEPALWDICLKYKFQNADEDSWKVDRDKAGKAFIYDWKLAAAIPTESEMEAVSTQALAWWTEKQKARKADFENWSSEELKALVKVLLKEINTLRAKANLEPRTADQLKTAIQAEM